MNSDEPVTRESVLKLMDKKREIEAKFLEWKEILDRNGVGMTDDLVDADGYPLQHIDIYEVRHARHNMICLQNDFKAIMKKIEEGLHVLHSQNNTTALESSCSTSRHHETNFVPIAKVTYVELGSPADLAGLHVDDFILSYGTIKHENFKSLKDLEELTQHSVDRQIPVTVRRQDGMKRLILVPQKWRGKGLLGCNILPVK